MSYFAVQKDVSPVAGSGHDSYTLLTEANGCVNGCVAGISVYTDTAYHMPGCHDDQEGFAVLSGTGMAKIGDEERNITPGMVFIVPKGFPHVIKTDSKEVPVSVFWFHAAV